MYHTMIHMLPLATALGLTCNQNFPVSQELFQHAAQTSYAGRPLWSQIDTSRHP